MVVPSLVMWPVFYMAGNVAIHRGDAAMVTAHVKGFFIRYMFHFVHLLREELGKIHRVQAGVVTVVFISCTYES
jgi:hypothetical protein